jgi:hypothetical protein
MLLLPGEAQAQAQPKSVSPIAVGTRIRLRAPTVVSGRIEGMIIEMDESSFLIGVNDRVPLTVSRQAISQLDMSTGQRRQALKGMIMGAGIGLAVFTLAGAAYQGDGSGSARDWASLLGTGLGGGAIWGAGIGALIKSDRWSAVPLERVRVSRAPTQRGGVRLSLSVRF